MRTEVGQNSHFLQQKLSKATLKWLLGLSTFSSFLARIMTPFYPKRKGTSYDSQGIVSQTVKMVANCPKLKGFLAFDL